MTAFFFEIENLVLRARLEFNGSAGKDCKLFWSIGVLEYWSVGESKSENFKLNESFHYSTTPADCRKRGKTIEAHSSTRNGHTLA